VNSERDPSLTTGDSDSEAVVVDIERRRRRRLTQGWFVLAMFYALFRIILADKFLVKYGLNIYAFAAIELVSTPIDAIGVSRTVQALVDQRRSSALRWMMVATTGYIAPDAYVVVAARQVPGSLYLGVLAWATLAMILGVRRLRRQIKLTRKKNAET
jgi:hypothetical protein